MRRVSREEQRLLVAQGLLALQKVDVLEASALADLLELPVVPGSYFGRGVRLATLLQEGAAQTLTKLQGLPRYELHCDLLRAVLQGSSIAAWAKGHGYSREWSSRTLWSAITSLVAQEVLAALHSGKQVG